MPATGARLRPRDRHDHRRDSDGVPRGRGPGVDAPPRHGADDSGVHSPRPAGTRRGAGGDSPSPGRAVTRWLGYGANAAVAGVATYLAGWRYPGSTRPPVTPNHRGAQLPL